MAEDIITTQEERERNLKALAELQAEFEAKRIRTTTATPTISELREAEPIAELLIKSQGFLSKIFAQANQRRGRSFGWPRSARSMAR